MRLNQRRQILHRMISLFNLTNPANNRVQPLLTMENTFEPQTIGNFGRPLVSRYGHRYSNEVIALAIEFTVANNLGPTEAARLMNFPKASLYKWLTKHWYYAKVENPVIIVLQSNV
jgi:hypothetical protein